MKALITATVLVLGLLAGPASARDEKSIWTTLNESAPRSIFDDIREAAPRWVGAGDVDGDLVGELAPAFETLRDNAP